VTATTKLEVGLVVVRTVAIDVVDSLALQQRSPQLLRHHKTMFQHISGAAHPHRRKRAVEWHMDKAIARVVSDPASPARSLWARALPPVLDVDTLL